MAIYGIRLQVLRLHDMGKSGSYWLLNFVPIACVVLWLALWLWPSNEDSNEYGPPAEPNSLGVYLGLALTALGWVMAIKLGHYMEEQAKRIKAETHQVQPQALELHNVLARA